MKEAMCTHLAKRGSRYYFRRKIPLDVRLHYKGREVMRSLGTSDRRQAERLARIIGVELDHEFERLRANHALDGGVLSVEQIVRPNLPTHTSGDSTMAPGFPHADVVQRHLPSEEGGKKELPEVSANEGGAGVAGAWMERRAWKRQPRPIEAPKGKTSLGVLIGRWASEVQPEQNTVKRTQMHARRFVEMAGVDTIEGVTRQHAIRFIEQLRQVGQTPQNINMHLASLIKLLNYAVRIDLIRTNEATGLTVKVPSGEKARRSFDLLALRSIFSSPVYTLRQRPKGGGGDASYWIPLLALFTGARLEELCQLHPDDVMQVPYHDEGGEASAWVIRITDEGEGQGLKNAGRDLPTQHAN